MYHQASEADASPIDKYNHPTAKFICQDPWISFLLTILTAIGILAYIYKHGKHLSLIYGTRFSSLCNLYMLVCSKTHFVRVKIGSYSGSPTLFTYNEEIPVDKVSHEKGLIWDYIHINWEDVKIYHSGKLVPLKGHVSIPLIDKIRLRRLIQQSVEYPLLVKQGDTWYTLRRST